MNANLHEAPVRDHPELAGHGPSADGDPMGTPAQDERILWKGRPDLSTYARTAFHTRKAAIYFAALIVLALAFGNVNGAIACAVLGVIGIAILQALAWYSARTTLYILTDQRLMMRVGMAIETRINVPLKQVHAAHFKPRDKGRGDIALELSGERLLGYWLLWPHARPWKFNMPQPMLRAIPQAEAVAKMLTEARSRFGSIERNLTEIKDQGAETGQKAGGPAARPNTSGELADRGLEGAPA
ncbi:hypothetical protein FIU90_13940 [Erythrobacter sp. THAF29]|nr:hypothetical protein FIU90_13940 [Erythrobacter sp. THAF29]